MTPETEADRLILEAKRHLRGAVASLVPIQNRECSGHDGYLPSYRATLMDVLGTLRDLLEDLR